MATLERIKVVWTGASGLPGVSVFYGAFGASANADVKTFFTALVASFPAGMTWAIPNSGDVITDSTGALTGAWANAAGGTVAATNASAYAAGCGAYVNWQTSTIVGRRRLTGRTFLAPIVTALYDAGTITNVNLAAFQTAATALVTAGNIRIWHRPHPGLADGTSAAPVAALVPDQVTSLRTRRR